MRQQVRFLPGAFPIQIEPEGRHAACCAFSKRVAVSAVLHHARSNPTCLHRPSLGARSYERLRPSRSNEGRLGTDAVECETAWSCRSSGVPRRRFSRPSRKARNWAAQSHAVPAIARAYHHSGRRRRPSLRAGTWFSTRDYPYCHAGFTRQWMAGEGSIRQTKRLARLPATGAAVVALGRRR